MPNDKKAASAGRPEYSAPQQAGRDNSLQSATAVAPSERQAATCDTFAAGGGRSVIDQHEICRRMDEIWRACLKPTEADYILTTNCLVVRQVKWKGGRKFVYRLTFLEAFRRASRTARQNRNGLLGLIVHG